MRNLPIKQNVCNLEKSYTECAVIISQGDHTTDLNPKSFVEACCSIAIELRYTTRLIRKFHYYKKILVSGCKNFDFQWAYDDNANISRQYDQIDKYDVNFNDINSDIHGDTNLSKYVM